MSGSGSSGDASPEIRYLARIIAAARPDSPYADSPCVRDDRSALTYREFSDRVDVLAGRLRREGLAAGDVLAIMLPNRAELPIAIMAAWRLGAVATPINPAFTQAEARYQIDDSGAAAAIVFGPDAPDLGCRTYRVDDLPISGNPVADDDVHPTAPAETALLIYTSGSTGRPKGVELTHANLQFMAETFRRHLRLTSDDHCLLILPLFHVNAICVSFLAPILAGAQLTITGRFSPSRFYEDVDLLRPTYFSAVPTIYALLAAEPGARDADTSCLRFGICGAAPISKELLDRVGARLNLTIIEGYGLTEGTCASACNPLDGPRKIGTVGPALPGQTITIIDGAGNPVPVGTSGEVTIDGPNVMRGYLCRPDETAATIVDGRLRTGDVGVLDEDGYLTLIDRIKDMIIRGGENLYPKEIENALAEHPAVLEAAVIGAPHEVYGEVPVAYVRSYPDISVAETELMDHVARRLTRVKVPTEIHLVDTLPRNPVGKIDKPQLRREYRPRSATTA